MFRPLLRCWMTKATDTYYEYVTIIIFPWQQCFRERASILRLKYICSRVLCYECVAVLKINSVAAMCNGVCSQWMLHFPKIFHTKLKIQNFNVKCFRGRTCSEPHITSLMCVLISWILFKEYTKRYALDLLWLTLWRLTTTIVVVPHR